MVTTLENQHGVSEENVVQGTYYTLPISAGGTGASDASAARTNLGLATAYSATSDYDTSKGTIEKRLSGLAATPFSLWEAPISHGNAIVNIFQR